MRRLLPVTILVLIAAVLTAGLLARPHPSSAPPGARPTPPRGQVVDESGRPLAGVRVSSPGSTVSTDAAGRFPVAVAPALYRFTAPGRLGRTVALSAQDAPSVRLGSSDAALSLRVGGDVMMGRRYLTGQDGERPAVPDPRDVAAHTAVLAGIAPQLEDADLTVVNLETPLVPDPWDGRGARPAGLNRAKDIVITSAPATATALRRSGVDVVSLANNHVADAGRAGLEQTLATLDRAGIASFGAGPDEERAWRPLVRTVRGRAVGLLGCTTVSGPQQEPYVAGPATPGAARCEPGRLTRAVRDLRARGALPVVMVHGGTEYVRAQTAQVRELTRLAVEAGAVAVLDGHPHVLGAVRRSAGAVVADSLGNLAFDQDLWETVLGATVRLELPLAGRGAPWSSVDPLVIDRYRPVPVTGAPARAVRQVAARGAAGAGAAGTDLLWGTGDVEATTTTAPRNRAPLWSTGAYAAVRPGAACAGAAGLQLLRSSLSTKDVYATPRHRAAVRPGERLRLQLLVNRATTGGRAEIRWYTGRAGASRGSAAVTLPQTDDGACRPVELSATVPAGVTAAQVFVRVDPPSGSTRANVVEVDDVRLLAAS